jgi:hypothetical protein
MSQFLPISPRLLLGHHLHNHAVFRDVIQLKELEVQVAAKFRARMLSTPGFDRGEEEGFVTGQVWPLRFCQSSGVQVPCPGACGGGLCWQSDSCRSDSVGLVDAAIRL